MATFGKIEEYCESDEWVQYVERLEMYFEANDIDDDTKKRSILLTVCGPKTYRLIRGLTAPEKPKEKSYETLTELLEKHYNPRPSEIVQRFKFNMRTQKPGESLADFVADSRRLSEHCNFQTALEDMLRDRLVCGVRDKRIQRRLLAEDSLTFQKAWSIATAMDVADRNAADLQQATGDSKEIQVNKLQFNDRSHTKRENYQNERSATQSECYRCGQAHDPRKCRWKNAVCHACQKTGHLARRCQSKKKSEPESKEKKAHFLTDVQEEETEVSEKQEKGGQEYKLYTLNLMQTRADRSKPIVVPLTLNKTVCEMELDTGAAVTVINENMYKTVCNGANSPALEPSKCTLRTYTGERVDVLGQVKLPVQYKGQQQTLTAQVVPGAQPNLMGRDWLEHIQLNWKDIFMVKSEKQEESAQKPESC